MCGYVFFARCPENHRLETKYENHLIGKVALVCKIKPKNICIKVYYITKFVSYEIYDFQNGIYHKRHILRDLIYMKGEGFRAR